jgi:hypothetical protein
MTVFETIQEALKELDTLSYQENGLVVYCCTEITPLLKHHLYEERMLALEIVKLL